MRIENLTQELDAETMTAVTGGDNGNSASNVIGQSLSIAAPVAVLGGGNSFANVTGTQSANVCNTQFGGDEFLAGLPECGFGPSLRRI